jgi:hypothetical protein
MHRSVLAALVFLMLGALTACGGAMKSSASKVDDRTYKIEGPGVPGGAEAPNRRLAERICPAGYRVLDSTRHKEGGVDTIDATVSTNWVIRCL